MGVHFFTLVNHALQQGTSFSTAEEEAFEDVEWKNLEEATSTQTKLVFFPANSSAEITIPAGPNGFESQKLTEDMALQLQTGSGRVVLFFMAILKYSDASR